MPSIFLLAVFLAFGITIAYTLFRDQHLIIILWLGIGIGLLGLMWGIVPFAFFLSFSPISHYAAVLLMAVLTLFIVYTAKKTDHKWGGMGQKKCFPTKLYLCFLIPVILLTIYLMNSHTLQPAADGGLYGGQSTYGDLALHLGIITGLGEQRTFPPDYTIFPGYRLSYPFLVNSLSSSLYLFGLPLRWSVLIPGYLLSFLVFTGFFMLALELLKNSRGAVVASILFFLNGGLGFIYFFDHVREHPENFYRIFSAWYETPTNYNEMSIRWSNVIADMLIPQRTTLAGWAFLFMALWLLCRGIAGKRRNCFLLSGILAGLLPMIHTHSYLAMGLMALPWMAAFFFQDKHKQNYLYCWLWFIIPAGLLSLPQLVYWTFPQSTGEGFVRLHFNWVSQQDNPLWFWVKNAGVVFVLLLPALMAATRKHLRLYSGALLIFLIANTIVFQPNIYDNNKLLYIWYAFSSILVSRYMLLLYKKLKGIPGLHLLAAFVLLLSTLSASLTLGREVVSGGKYLQFDAQDIAAAEYIRTNTPADALFVTGDQHLNPVSALAGRNILSGTVIYLYYHGIDYRSRAADIEKIYRQSETADTLLSHYQIDYILLSRHEQYKYDLDPEIFETRYPVVFHTEDILIFAISQRAKEHHRIDALMDEYKTLEAQVVDNHGRYGCQ